MNTLQRYEIKPRMGVYYIWDRELKCYAKTKVGNDLSYINRKNAENWINRRKPVQLTGG